MENKITLISSQGNNYTVIKEIMETYRQYRGSVKGHLDDLKNLPVIDKCYSIFDYVLSKVKYSADQGRDQYIQTPERLMLSGKGDCKSMAIFAASCLKEMNIPCWFRFVSFNDSPIYTHVYVVAQDEDGREIIIDPVDRYDNKPKFNYARPFVLKKDIRA